MTPSKINTTKLFAAALGGGLALGAFVAPTVPLSCVILRAMV
ncbi:hypothetical protein [Corynebacterium argentoratense]|nr:hypothetical protein [Corynebacterium argentoratense]